MSNPCVRCGKQRIDGKTWKGKVGASSITYTMTVCPDKDCQAKVDQAIAERKEKNVNILKAKEKAKEAKAKLSAASQL